MKERTQPGVQQDGNAPEKTATKSESPSQRLANRFRRIKILCVILLISFLVAMVVLFRDSITIENMRYFLRYLDTRQAQSDSVSTIKYDSTSVTDAALFKGGLVLVDPDRIGLYDLNGDSILSVEKSNPAPLCVCNSDMFLVYSIGSNNYQIYNSLTCLHEETLDYPISFACVSEKGYYLIGTKSMEYRSMINIYDADFEMIYQWSSPDKYLFGAAIRPDGREFAAASLYSNLDGSCTMVLSLYRTDSEQVKQELSLQNEVPLSLHYTGKDKLVLFTDCGVYFYDENLKVLAQHSFDGFSPVSAQTLGEYSYFALNRNVVGSDHEVTILDDKGEILYRGALHGEIADCTQNNGVFYFLMAREILCVEPATGTVSSLEISDGAQGLLVTDNDLLIRMQGKTEVMSLTAFHAAASVVSP